MGYYVNYEVSELRIKAENVEACLAAINAMPEVLGKIGFSWVYYPEEGWDTLEQALEAWRWFAAKSSIGDIVVEAFEGEKMGDDEWLFETIAPFVEESPLVGGSAYVEGRGEDGCMWRYAFIGGKMVRQSPTITWE